MSFHTPPQAKPRLVISLAAAAALTALFLSGCATTAGAQKGAAARTTTASTNASSSTSGSVQTASGVLRTTLSNGLRVVIVSDPLAPVVTQQITYFVGSNQSPPGFPGMAHAQEHMMFRGANGITGNQISEISAQLGGNMDAFTTENTTSYYFTVPADNLGLTLKMGALRMSSVNDKAADWQKERGAIEQEVARDNSNPLYVLQSKAQAHVFAGTPYAHTGLGTKPSFDKTTAAMLKKFYDTWYAPNNALLVVAGDVNPQSTLAKIKALYGKIPSKKLPAKKKITLSPVNPESFTSKTDQPYGMVAYVFRMPGYRSSSYPTAELLSSALNSRRGPLAALTYEGKALGSGFDYNTLVDTGYGYAWAAFPPGGDPKAMAKDLKAAVEKAISGIPADLVAAQKRQALLGNALRRNSISGLAQAWTDAISLEGISSPAVDTQRLQKVGTAEVNKAAKQYLDFSHAVTLELTPTPGAHPQSGGQIFGSPESFNSKPQKSVTLPDWAATALAKLPSPKPHFTPTDYHLPNGLRLIVQPIAHSTSVSLFGSVHTRESLEAPAGQEGVGSLLDSLYEWGPAGMTRSEFEAKMDALGASYSVGSSFSLQVLPKYFSKGVSLLSKDLLNPSLPRQAFQSQQRIFVQELAGRMSSPLFKFNRAVAKGLLPAGDPALRIPTPQSVRSLTLADINSYEAKVMRPDVTTIVVMGDVKPAQVKSLIEKYFGGWQSHGPKPDLFYKPVTQSKPTQVFVPDQFRKQDEVILAETVDSSYNDPQHYGVELGNTFLGGDLFASPLYRELRVKRGLVYYVGSSAGFSRTRASFRVNFGAYPNKVQEAKQLAIQQVKAMADRPMTADELHLAKASALRQIELTNQSIGDVAGSWLSYSNEGLSLNRLYLVAQHYENLTSAQIQAAFKKYVDPNRLSTFVLGKPIGK